MGEESLLEFCVDREKQLDRMIYEINNRYDKGVAKDDIMTAYGHIEKAIISIGAAKQKAHQSK